MELSNSLIIAIVVIIGSTGYFILLDDNRTNKSEMYVGCTFNGIDFNEIGDPSADYVNSSKISLSTETIQKIKAERQLFFDSNHYEEFLNRTNLSLEIKSQRNHEKAERKFPKNYYGNISGTVYKISPYIAC